MASRTTRTVARTGNSVFLRTGGGLRAVRVLCTRDGRRAYHDESYGFRTARPFELPDYTPDQLANRTANAPLLRYVDSLRTHGHRAARIDPLDLMQREEVPALSPARYGLADPARTYDVDGILWTRPVGAPDAGAERWALADITRHLRAVYVGRVAYEYMHSPSKTERNWFAHLLEAQPLNPGPGPADEERRHVHGLLARSEVFDRFLQAKFPNLKRYGLEGGESMLPALDALFGAAAKAGIEQVILAMPHRGRLNLLTDLLKYEPAALFHKIRGNSELPEELGACGDVISHLTASPDLVYAGSASPLRVSLEPNPSHLEAANPVALGKARAKQYARLRQLQQQGKDECALGDRVMCVQLHGDASFTGQGVVMETLGLSNLPHYTTGGSVHVVVNNNVGYTTPAASARSSLYCSDIGKMIHAPVLHVNGDYPEDVARAMETAFKYRNHFRKDIIIDLIVYRRWGHNELDEPAFTQPAMYRTIRSRKSVPALYEERLIDEGVITAEDASRVRDEYKAHLEAELARVDSYVPPNTALKGQWNGIVWAKNGDAVPKPDTGVEAEVLRGVGRASVTVPEGFEIHKRLQRHVGARLEAVESGYQRLQQDKDAAQPEAKKGLDWATAEAMAFGSLMREGIDVRISGQDVGRGTFSHRHAMLVDQNTEKVIVPLNDQLQSEGRLELANSSLSEMAVLGFEIGVSWEKPNILPIWEAQFGDFFNGAQVMIDTFVASGETKWLKQSGLVMLLPHGLDGAGPEHSSSRIERFLQLTNDRHEYDPSQPHWDVNMQVAFPTTPGQYFHLLRRQVKRNFRKPLVVAAPKGLLRLPAASSSMAELLPGTQFRPVLDDIMTTTERAKRIILCTGKLYYELAAARTARNLTDSVAIIRVEELCPFPFAELEAVLERYPENAEMAWVQEEPRNQGAWGHVRERVESVLAQRGDKKLTFVGRASSAVPAPGVGKVYKREQEEVITKAFEGI